MAQVFYYRFDEGLPKRTPENTIQAHAVAPADLEYEILPSETHPGNVALMVSKTFPNGSKMTLAGSVAKGIRICWKSGLVNFQVDETPEGVLTLREM